LRREGPLNRWFGRRRRREAAVSPASFSTESTRSGRSEVVDESPPSAPGRILISPILVPKAKHHRWVRCASVRQ
jgi:hypothetical protein